MTEKNMQLYTIEGAIQAFQIAPGIVNLIEDVQAGTFFSGVVSGMSGESGLLANAGSVALYDGEDVEHIALLLNGRMAIGTFEWLRDLSVGDDVMLVVSEIPEGPLFVHAILRKNDQLLWTPYSVDHTRRGWIMHGVKMASVIIIFTWLMFGLFHIIDGKFPSKTILFWLGLFPIMLMGFVTFMSLQGVMHLGDHAEDIFQALGVPKFERFKIKPFSVRKVRLFEDPDALKKGHIFYFSDAVAAHKKRFNLQ